MSDKRVHVRVGRRRCIVTVARASRALAVLIAVTCSSAGAAPNVPLDDPAMDEVARRETLGLVEPVTGGIRPLTEDRVREILGPDAAGERPPSGFWLDPVHRAALRVGAAHGEPRPYSTPARPRLLAGELFLACEHGEGAPCSPGGAGWVDLDSAAGVGTWGTAFARVRASAGSGANPTRVEVDRGYLSAALGPVAIEVGRDVLALGPGRTTQLLWSDHAPPIDQVRIVTTRPFPLLGARGELLRASALYMVGRLGPPQRFTGTMVDAGRLQLDVLDRVGVGLTQVMQFGGAGAPGFGAWEWLVEHVRRHQTRTTLGFANHRVGADASVVVPSLGLRAYYETAIEDARRHVWQAVRYDFDHLVGLELERPGPHGLFLEAQRTGVRSQEHQLFTDGLTHRGFVLGSPLGPDAVALLLGARLRFERFTVTPWLQTAWISSDRYRFLPVEGEILFESAGVTERRLRGGVSAAIDLAPAWHLQVEAAGEHTRNFGFVAGARSMAFDTEVALVWTAARVPSARRR